MPLPNILSRSETEAEDKERRQNNKGSSEAMVVPVLE